MEKKLLLLVVLVLGIVGYLFFQTSQTNKALLDRLNNLEKSESKASSSVAAGSSSSVVSQEKKESIYNDARLKNFIISYDEKDWTVRVLEQEEVYKKTDMSYQGPGVLFEGDNGVLYIHFNLAFGVGGGATPFSSTEITSLKNGWARMQKENVSYYGLEKTLKYYKDNNDDLLAAKDYCSKVLKGEDAGYPIFEESACTLIQDGTYVGYAPQPTFTRSPRFARSVSMSQINASWAGDSYVVETGIDDGYIITEISYSGSSPEAADLLVEQLKIK